MNRRPQVPKPASAIEGFLQTKQAEDISYTTHALAKDMCPQGWLIHGSQRR